jgi:hypothetical protein
MSKPSPSTSPTPGPGPTPEEIKALGIDPAEFERPDPKTDPEEYREWPLMISAYRVLKARGIPLTGFPPNADVPEDELAQADGTPPSKPEKPKAEKKSPP